ncbi:MAG: hypothetical protein HKL90_00675 [Elusimicrobia bacterium]|nr:hypothetical protein [Elusimicrobiota bacterium]
MTSIFSAAPPPRRALIAVFAVALAARLLAVAWTGRGDAERVGDAADYHAYAASLVERGRYENAEGERASRMPGYPLLLAAQYAALGRSPLLTQILQCLLGALTCVLVVALAARWSPPPWPLAAGLLAALSWDMIEPCARLLTEAPAALCLTLTLWLLAQDRALKPGRAALAGLPAAAAFLLRPECGPWAALAALYTARRARPSVGAAFLTATLLAAGAWGARNARTLGRPVLTTTAGAFNLYGWGAARTVEERLGGPHWEHAPAQATELTRMDFYAAKTREFFASVRPATLLKALSVNLALLYYPFSPELDPTFAFVAPFALLGLWAVRADPRRRPLGLTLAYFTAVYCLAGVMIPRHRESYAPLTVLLAAAGLEWTRARSRPRAFAAAVAAWGGTCLAAWAAAPWLRAAALAARDRVLS